MGLQTFTVIFFEGGIQIKAAESLDEVHRLLGRAANREFVDVTGAYNKRPCRIYAALFPKLLFIAEEEIDPQAEKMMQAQRGGIAIPMGALPQDVLTRQ